jgi:hypothetical protein
MVMDHYWDKWQTPRHFPEYPQPLSPYKPMPISDEEITEFRKLLERAREYDKRNNEPNCEMEEKRQRLLKLADELGVKIDFV